MFILKYEDVKYDKINIQLHQIHILVPYITSYKFDAHFKLLKSYSPSLVHYTSFIFKFLRLLGILQGNLIYLWDKRTIWSFTDRRLIQCKYLL